MIKKLLSSACLLCGSLALVSGVLAQQSDDVATEVPDQPSVQQPQDDAGPQPDEGEVRGIDSGDSASFDGSEPYVEEDEEGEEDEELLQITDDSMSDPAAEDSASPEELDHIELARSFELYQSAVENGSFDEADTLAKHVVELSIKLYGINSHYSAKALTNLGVVQYHNKDFDSAQLNYQAAIDILERIEDRLYGGLLNPLKGLGAAQLSAGRPDLAEETFHRAVHISHVNEGPHNLLQVEVLDALTETYLSVGDIEEAVHVQENVYNLQLRNVDPNSEDALPALERQATWMHRIQHYNAERLAYRKIIHILESAHGKDDISLIPPLTGLGKSYLFIEPYDSEFQSYTPASGGEVYLKRALRIAEESPDSDWQLKRNCMLALGDFYTLAGRANRAERTYDDVWNFLSTDGEKLASRVKELESPVVLQTINPTVYYNSTRQDYGATTPENFVRGTIVVGYNIDEFGQSKQIAIIEAKPPGLIDLESELLRQVRSLVHRPRFKDGEIVEIDDATYTHEFFYRPSDLTDSEENPTLTGSLAPDQ